MEQTIKTISINGIDYVEKSIQNQQAETFEGLPYVICRTYSAGVFAGYIASRSGQEVVLKKARRLWYWDGASSLSQLAMEGVSRPENCKFPCEVNSVTLLQTIEILDVTKKAQDNIKAVKIWKQ